MSDSYYGEIRMFGGNYAPAQWAFCSGQTYPISQNTALFSILGTAYGGDGRSTFGLPNLSGRSVMGAGKGTGLTQRYIYQPVGQETVTLTFAEMASHTHALKAAATAGTLANPDNNVLAQGYTSVGPPPARNKKMYAGQPNVNMNPQMLASAGDHASHENRQPFLAVSFILSLYDTFPVRN